MTQKRPKKRHFSTIFNDFEPFPVIKWKNMTENGKKLAKNHEKLQKNVDF